MSKSHRNTTKVLEFNNKEDMIRFIVLYRDLFVPYSDDKIRCASYVQDIPTYWTINGNLMSRGHHDDNIVRMMKDGYRIQNNILKINILPEDWRKIESVGVFEKTKVARARYKYVYVG